MSSFLGARATGIAHGENAQFIGKAAAPAAANPAQAVQRRVLGDVTNASAAAPGIAKPAAKPATIPFHAAFGGAAASSASSSAAELSSDLVAAAGGMDVDTVDADVPEAVAEYVNDIYATFKETEIAKTAKYGYMAHQTDINEKMRAILIDWLVEVHLKFKLAPETMFLTVNLIDRFLERKLVVRQKLQLVGVTAMLLAAKYEEIYAPEVQDFVYITDKAYAKDQILMMEATMLTALDFRITVPTPYVFLNRFLKVAGQSEAGAKVSLLATYLVERSLQDYKMLHYPPSKIAAAAVNMALRTLRGPAAWDAKLEKYSGYRQSDLTEAVRDIQGSLDAQATSNLKAVHKKYLNPKLGEVSLIPVAPL